jgi:hypothetical protein
MASPAAPKSQLAKSPSNKTATNEKRIVRSIMNTGGEVKKDAYALLCVTELETV